MGITYNTVVADDRGYELNEHGTGLFPVAAYFDDLDETGFAWHWHDELEAFVVAEGTALVMGGSERRILHAGQAFFANAGTLHAGKNVSARTCMLHSVVFHPRLVGGGMDSVFWQKYVGPLIGDRCITSLYFDGSEPWHAEAIDAIERAWHSMVEEEAGYEFHVRSALSDLVLCLGENRSIEGRAPSEREARESERVKDMLRYIQGHYGEPMTVARIADAASVSETECLRCFRAVIGRPPMQYVRQFRLQHAADQLVDGEERVADIGMRCGFPDASYFVSCFKKEYGMTPGQYRAARRVGRGAQAE